MTHMIRKVQMILFRCRACKSTERPHVAKGLCERCYNTVAKRKARSKRKGDEKTV